MFWFCLHTRQRFRCNLLDLYVLFPTSLAKKISCEFPFPHLEECERQCLSQAHLFLCLCKHRGNPRENRRLPQWQASKSIATEVVQYHLLDFNIVPCSKILKHYYSVLCFEKKYLYMNKCTCGTSTTYHEILPLIFITHQQANSLLGKRRRGFFHPTKPSRLDYQVPWNTMKLALRMLSFHRKTYLIITL
jgi:hypothetical protein